MSVSSISIKRILYLAKVFWIMLMISNQQGGNSEINSKKQQITTFKKEVFFDLNLKVSGKPNVDKILKIF